MSGLGKHLLAEFYGCPLDKLGDIELLRSSALRAVERAGATILSHHFALFEPAGISGVVIISESHLSLHTWPDHLFMALDFFTCSDSVDSHLAVDLMAEAVQPRRVTRSLCWRGADLAQALHSAR